MSAMGGKRTLVTDCSGGVADHLLSAGAEVVFPALPGTSSHLATCILDKHLVGNPGSAFDFSPIYVGRDCYPQSSVGSARGEAIGARERPPNSIGKPLGEAVISTDENCDWCASQPWRGLHRLTPSTKCKPEQQPKSLHPAIIAYDGNVRNGSKADMASLVRRGLVTGARAG